MNLSSLNFYLNQYADQHKKCNEDSHCYSTESFVQIHISLESEIK